jgi:hypothetical protein
MENKGWIALYRSMADHPLWTAEKFTKAQAWLDLLMMAVYINTDLVIGLTPVTLERGEILTSKVKLANRWKWDRETVTRFLMYLRREGMCHSKTNRDIEHGFTVISIQNFDKYQFIPQQMPQQIPQQLPQQIPHIQQSNKVYKYREVISPTNIQYLENIPLEDINNLTSIYEVTSQQIKEKAQSMILYCQRENKPYKDYKLALQDWILKDFGLREEKVKGVRGSDGIIHL